MSLYSPVAHFPWKSFPLSDISSIDPSPGLLVSPMSCHIDFCFAARLDSSTSSFSEMYQLFDVSILIKLIYSKLGVYRVEHSTCVQSKTAEMS